MIGADVVQLALLALTAGGSVGTFYRLGRLTAKVENHGERLAQIEGRFFAQAKG